VAPRSGLRFLGVMDPTGSRWSPGAGKGAPAGRNDGAWLDVLSEADSAVGAPRGTLSLFWGLG
jgi:hypothetical protein